MKYLMDVNTLVAWHHTIPTDKHTRIHEWRRRANPLLVSTCAICELGFVRISMSAYGYDREMAQRALERLKRDMPGYIDSLPSPVFAQWVLSHKHTTDAYLCQLAAANGMKLATFDAGIKDAAAFLIP